MKWTVLKSTIISKVYFTYGIKELEVKAARREVGGCVCVCVCVGGGHYISISMCRDVLTKVVLFSECLERGGGGVCVCVGGGGGGGAGRGGFIFKKNLGRDSNTPVWKGVSCPSGKGVVNYLSLEFNFRCYVVCLKWLHKQRKSYNFSK